MTSVSSSSSSTSSLVALMQQMQKNKAAMFAKADTDGSGGLSLDEFKAVGTKGGTEVSTLTDQQVEEKFASLDTDGDGSLTQAEIDAGDKNSELSLLSSKILDALFAILGSDGSEEDGSTTETADAASAPPPPPPPMQTADASSGSTETYDALDTNQDGVVSVDELMAALNNSGDTSSTASSDTQNSAQSMLTELKTAVKTFLLALQEQQQKQQVA